MSKYGEHGEVSIVPINQYTPSELGIGWKLLDVVHSDRVEICQREEPDEQYGVKTFDTPVPIRTGFAIFGRSTDQALVELQDRVTELTELHEFAEHRAAEAWADASQARSELELANERIKTMEAAAEEAAREIKDMREKNAAIAARAGRRTTWRKKLVEFLGKERYDEILEKIGEYPE